MPRSNYISKIVHLGATAQQVTMIKDAERKIATEPRQMDEKLEIGNTVAMLSFAAVVSTGSFSAAAEVLGYSKAAISRQVAQLESRIGLKLLERTTRSVALTPAGREIYSRCSRIVDEVKEVNDLLGGIQSKPRGDLRVSAPVVASLFRITHLFPQFLKNHPELRLFLTLTDNNIDLLKGDFDIAFWVGDTFDSTLEAVKLWEYEMILVGAEEYFSKRGYPKSAGDLKDHDCIVETHLSRPGEWRLSNDQTIQINRVHLTSNSVRITREAVLSGMGIAFLPRFLLEDDLASKRLIPVLSNIVTTRLPLHLIFPKGRYILAKVKAFVDFFSSAIGGNDKPDIQGALGSDPLGD